MVAAKIFITSALVAVASAQVSQFTDGQPQGTVKATQAPVSVFTDGQPQATVKPTSVAPIPVSVYTDGQPQATVKPTPAPIPVSVYTDGQPQATVKPSTLAPVVNATVSKPAPTIVASGASLFTVSNGIFGAALALAVFTL